MSTEETDPRSWWLNVPDAEDALETFSRMALRLLAFRDVLRQYTPRDGRGTQDTRIIQPEESRFISGEIDRVERLVANPAIEMAQAYSRALSERYESFHREWATEAAHLLLKIGDAIVYAINLPGSGPSGPATAEQISVMANIIDEAICSMGSLSSLVSAEVLRAERLRAGKS